MSAIIIPEYIIVRSLQAILDAIRDDITTNESTPDKSYLYELIGEDEDGNLIKMNRYNFFEQSRDLFLKNLPINYGFNLEVANEISIHVILPSESGKPSALGVDEGYLTRDDGVICRTQTFDSTYQLLITSSNQAEVLTVYNVIKSLLLLLFPTIDMLGLRNPQISGSDVMFRQDYVPANIFSKAVNLSFNYDLTVPTSFVASIINKITFKGTPLNL